MTAGSISPGLLFLDEFITCPTGQIRSVLSGAGRRSSVGLPSVTPNQSG